MAQEKKHHEHEHQQASEFIENLKSTIENFDAEESAQAMQESAKEIADVATEFIRKYPIQSVLGAAAIGFLVCAFIKRK